MLSNGFVFLVANCHCTWGRFADQRTPVLWPVHVWGHLDAYPQLLARRSVARAPSHQWCHACRWVHGVPPPLECNAVCVLHSSRHSRVHSRVSNTRFMYVRMSKRQLNTRGGLHQSVSEVLSVFHASPRGPSPTLVVAAAQRWECNFHVTRRRRSSRDKIKLWKKWQEKQHRHTAWWSGK